MGEATPPPEGGGITATSSHLGNNKTANDAKNDGTHPKLIPAALPQGHAAGQLRREPSCKNDGEEGNGNPPEVSVGNTLPQDGGGVVTSAYVGTSHYSRDGTRANPYTLTPNPLFAAVHHAHCKNVPPPSFRYPALPPEEFMHWHEHYLKITNLSDASDFIGRVLLRLALDMRLSSKDALTITSHLMQLEHELLAQELRDHTRGTNLIHQVDSMLTSPHRFEQCATHDVERIINNLSPQDRLDFLGTLLEPRVAKLTPTQPNATIITITSRIISRSDEVILAVLDRTEPFLEMV